MRIGGDRLILRLINDIASVATGQRALREFLVRTGASERAIFQCELAFEELVTNVIHHAYAGRAQATQSIDVTVAIEPDKPDEIVMHVEDDGPPFDPAQAPDRPLPVSLEEARVGGLGIRFIRASTTRFVYQRAGGRNRVTVHVERHAGSAADG